MCGVGCATPRAFTLDFAASPPLLFRVNTTSRNAGDGRRRSRERQSRLPVRQASPHIDGRSPKRQKRDSDGACTTVMRTAPFITVGFLPFCPAICKTCILIQSPHNTSKPAKSHLNPVEILLA